MPDSSVERLIKRRDAHTARIDAIKESASAKDADLTEDEVTLIREASDDIDKIDEQLEVLTRDTGMDDEARNRIARVSRGVTPVVRYRSAGEVVWDVLHQGEDDDAKARYRGALTRAAEHMGTDKADTTAVAGDLLGLTIVPKIGPVVNPVERGMRFLTALGVKPMPGAFKFERPYIVDAAGIAGVGEQALEKAELVSKAFEIESDTLKAKTYGGYLNISQQLLAMGPGSLQVIIDQLRWRLSRQLEAASVTALGESTGAIDLAANADAKTIYAALFDASVAVWTATGMPAEWVLMGPLGWARLGKLTDAADRPLLPALGGQNTMGGASADSFEMAGPAGLMPIVSGAITDDSFWVGNGSSMEAYLYQFPVLEAVEPSVLGRQVAVAAGLVTHRPTPSANAAQHLRPAPI